MPPREEEIDYACSNCGKVVRGPHQGEVIPDVTHKGQYKGAEISHSMCEDCAKANVADAKQQSKTHPYWRKPGNKP